MNQKLESLVRAMDEYAQVERDCSLRIVGSMASNQVDVEVRFDVDDEFDVDATLRFVLVDMGTVIGREMVEVWVSGLRVLVSAIPAAVLAVVLGL